VPFKTPTSKLPTLDDEKPSIAHTRIKGKADSSTVKQPRPHGIDRASSWRERQAADGGNDYGGDDTSEGKRFLNTKQKKKIAFINHEFHSSADTMNAYIVFAHSPPLHLLRPDLSQGPAVMDPYEAARLAVEKCDGSMFMDRFIRVDRAVKASTNGVEKTAEGLGDPKLSVFVGNLDFASKEEDLRVFFEGVVSAERGPPPTVHKAQSSADIEKSVNWVTRVRIVRDKDTQLGKGFAYVQFCVSLLFLFFTFSWKLFYDPGSGMCGRGAWYR
jgi:nucleolar protein 12